MATFGSPSAGRTCRRFDELAQAGPAPIASEALARIVTLYKVEGEIRGRSPETTGNPPGPKSSAC